MVSPWYMLLCNRLHLQEVDNDMVSKIQIGMSTTNMHLIQFKHGSLKSGYITTHSEEYLSEFYDITFAIVHFFAYKCFNQIAT